MVEVQDSTHHVEWQIMKEPSDEHPASGMEVSAYTL